MSAGRSAASKSGPPDPLIGRVIAGRYAITSLIARGGMGKVYRAEQAPLGRPCAIKVLNPNYNGDADPEFHRRFSREASITSKITHPNCVTIFDYGRTDDDVFYMVMEYLEGQTLHAALREVKTMPEERAGRIAQQICRALREAHQLGVIHRDLKPANIFLTRPQGRTRPGESVRPGPDDDDDFVKVLDFGLVKQLSEQPEEQLTQTGLFMGSPKYMAPEQIQGGHVDARTDIYALGIILYEMMSGKVPFERATSVNILMAHVGEPPPPMREVNPNLVCSPMFEELVMRCIAKDPAERFASMDEVLQAIKMAHGVSMTGQVEALGSSSMPPRVAAAFASVGPMSARSPAHPSSAPPSSIPSSSPPSSIPSSAPPSSSSASAPGMASGVHSPMMVTPSTDAVVDASQPNGAPAPRSRGWIVLGVLASAVLGSTLGVVAFRMTPPVVPVAQPTSPSVTASPSPSVAPAPPASTAAPSASAAPSSSVTAAVRSPSLVGVVTDPPGANVRSDAAELCAATPCDVALEGPNPRPMRITVAKVGFKTETRTVKPGDAQVVVKLVRQAAHVPSVPVRPPPKGSSDTPTPAGFRDAY